MITIFAEKPDMGTKIAAALDSIHLHNGTAVPFNKIGNHEKLIGQQRRQDGFFEIEYNGEQTYVTWGYGHICGLKQASDYNPEYKNWRKIPLPFIPDYELKLLDDRQDQYNVIRDLFQSSDLIICATDNDREGDLIFDYIYQYMDCKTPYERVIFNKQTQEEFVKAFQPQNLVSSAERVPVVEAGRARSEADFIVGANLTTAMTLQCSSKDVLSVGRVQTAVLNMIVERERAIQDFTPEPYWVLKAKFTTDDGEQYEGVHKTKKFSDKRKAEDILSRLGRSGVVAKIDKKTYSKDKPNLYSLQALQMDANKRYGFSLEKTLDLAQELYEGGYTTYPRTDSMYLTEDMGPEMTSVLKMLFSLPQYNDLSVNVKVNVRDRHYFDNSKVESHYAIVPTTKKPEDVSGDATKVYDLIARSVICMAYPKALMSKMNVVTEVDGEPFNSSGSSVVEPGFYKVIGKPKETMLPALSEGETVRASCEIDEKQTEPPKRYTDATLLTAMMTCGKSLDDEELKAVMTKGPEPIGLGRPSTQASVVSTLEKRGYIYRQRKTIYPTDKGMDLIDIFPVEDLKSPVMTASWEKRLDDIENGKESYRSFMDDMERSVSEWTMMIQNSKIGAKNMNTETDLTCPFCGRPMQTSKYGLQCSGWKDGCKFSVYSTMSGYDLTQDDIDRLCHGEKTIVHSFTSRNGKQFTARLVLDTDAHKVTYEFADDVHEDMICPLCGKPLKTVPWGYGCTGYQANGCRFSIGEVGGKKLTENQVKQLLNGKEIMLKGLTSKSGNRFDANVYLALDGQYKGRVQYDFDD